MSIPSFIEGNLPITLPDEIKSKLDELGDIRHKKELIHFLEMVFARYDIKFAALFGSVVRGEDTAQSDLDVLLVASNFPSALGDRLDQLHGFFIPHIDFRAHTLLEFRKMASSWHLTVLEVCHDHCFLYDPDSLGTTIYREFIQHLEAGELIRGDHFWKLNFTATA